MYFLISAPLSAGEATITPRTNDETATNTALVAPCAFHCLSHFHFDDGNWNGRQGQTPLLAAHLLSTNSFDGQGILIDKGANRSVLRYRTTESNGHKNVSSQNGTIRFLFRSRWASQGNMGNGPGDWARLLEFGTWTEDASAGWLALTVDRTGTNVWLCAQDGRGHTSSNVVSDAKTRRLVFNANLWTEFTLTYSEKKVTLWRGTYQYLDLNRNRVHLPDLANLSAGFALGSDSEGLYPAQGTFDELEILDYALSPPELEASNTRIIAATPLRNGSAIQLQWRALPYMKTTLERRRYGDTHWTTLQESTAWHYQDRQIDSQQDYEYRVSMAQFPDRPGSIVSAVAAPPTEFRGRIVVLTDRTLARQIPAELIRLRQDLVADGWIVHRKTVPRQDDRDSPRNAKAAAKIREEIQKIWSRYPDDTRAVLLLGHVPVPYSGNLNPDGHAYRPWPTDAYYGDIDGVWTDEKDYSAKNRAGDGVFDQNSTPSPVELAVGRVDFANLPSLDRSRGRATTDEEVRLLRQYLNKNHHYRTGKLSLPQRVVVGAFFGSSEDLDIRDNAIRNATRWFSPTQERFIADDLFASGTPALWGMLGGYGNYSQVRGAGGRQHGTQSFTSAEYEPPIAFYLLKGSYFGEWNTIDNLLRAVLSGPNYGLASMWTRGPGWQLHAPGLGKPLGDALIHTQNAHQRRANIVFALMGDPTLRFPVVPPPQDLSTRRIEEGIELTWTHTGETPPAYYIYRSTQGADVQPDRITPQAVNATRWIDTAAPRGRTLYMLRALQPTTTPSGTFTNLSQGVFAIESRR